MPKPSPGPPVNSCCKFHPPPLSVNTYTAPPPVCVGAPIAIRGPVHANGDTEGVVRRAIGSRQLRLQAPYSAAARKDVCGSLKEILAISPDHRVSPLTDTAAPKKPRHREAETSGSLNSCWRPHTPPLSTNTYAAPLKADWISVGISPDHRRGPAHRHGTAEQVGRRAIGSSQLLLLRPRPRPRSTGTERPSSRRHPPARRAETPAPGLGKPAGARGYVTAHRRHLLMAFPCVSPRFLSVCEKAAKSDSRQSGTIPALPAAPIITASECGSAFRGRVHNSYTMAVTMKDIARELGVSVVTVSKVVRNHK